MDVHGTILARTLFTIATGVERGAAEQSLAADGARMGFISKLFLISLNADRSPSGTPGLVCCTVQYGRFDATSCHQHQHRLV
jgi:hypothetical protein